MTQQATRFDFENKKIPRTDFVLFENIIEDRGSRYSVSLGLVRDRNDIKRFLRRLKENKKYLKADHNTWATRIAKDGAIFETKSDDGEVGAGMVILRVMQKEEVSDCVICVTRWFGGVKLMGDRFKHVQDATKHAIEQM
ncbi:MAG: YigZ family protein [Candidatus Nomurabacteria bacterium]|nr:MAG: YigZ family protein [Candidatus Nomurabacteria bacterium]